MRLFWMYLMYVMCVCVQKCYRSFLSGVCECKFLSLIFFLYSPLFFFFKVSLKEMKIVFHVNCSAMFLEKCVCVCVM